MVHFIGPHVPESNLCLQLWQNCSRAKHCSQQMMRWLPCLCICDLGCKMWAQEHLHASNFHRARTFRLQNLRQCAIETCGCEICNFCKSVRAYERSEFHLRLCACSLELPFIGCERQIVRSASWPQPPHTVAQPDVLINVVTADRTSHHEFAALWQASCGNQAVRCGDGAARSPRSVQANAETTVSDYGARHCTESLMHVHNRLTTD